MPEWAIETPMRIKTGTIEDESNAEVRRAFIEIYGEARYLEDSGAGIIASDDVGDLYRKDIPGDEPLVMVRVLNSTPEPDGSIKPYMLRVPPDMRTPREAIAWTFGMSESEYRPAVET